MWPRFTGHVGQSLSAELGRALDSGGSAARHAEIALGDGPMRQRVSSSIRALAEYRGPRSSICPSDAARAIGGEGWRDLMTDAYEVARDLAKDGSVEITQGGQVLDPDGDWRGPIRIRSAGGSPRV
jgi:hypothetical protein